ncbi:MAG: hypothetical protein HYV27_11245 [Candidatus Hydrogenedentes bacterium]|nr:hypothetical protein [Candidatus Hydrogenedentota bacterium]
MNLRHLLPACLTLLVIASPALADVPLNEGWMLQSSEKLGAGGETLSLPGVDTAAWYPVTLPKTVLAALVDKQVYPDPYYGLNLKSIPGYKEAPWLVMPQDSPFRHSWWYRWTHILTEAPKAAFQFLCLDGVNYQANIWLNGEKIADAQDVKGMFLRFRFDITGKLRAGQENVLAIEVIPPGLIPDKEYKTKQVEATTGWDDHNPQPPDLNMGLWQRVYIEMVGPVSVSDPYVDSKLELPSLASADLTASAIVTNNTDQPQTGDLYFAFGESKLDSTHIAQAVTLQPHESREVVLRVADHPELHVAKPRVWWPHPLGPQELYVGRFHFQIKEEVIDVVYTRFGIREITSYINGEDWRVFKVNGKEILIRGGAWMTSDMMLNLSGERYEALVRYAREAGFNMLRSEGFSIRETEAFYDKCDELGVMVTQQIFGRSIPDEDLAIACVDGMLRRIRTHPSLVHLLGHDETFPTDRLDAAYRDLIGKYRVNRSYQPHSGAFDVKERAETGGTRTGTRELWTYASPSHYYFKKDDGAWGFAQSGGIGGVLAARDSIAQMLPPEQRWPALTTEAWSFHTVTQGGEYFNAVKDAMTVSYGEARDLEDFCRKGYAMNYDSARGMFEAYGRNKYAASGITTWKYNAAWPAAMTWHYVDWYLRPTAAYYGAKKACEPLHVQYAYDDASVYVVNNLREDFTELHVSATLFDAALQERGKQDADLNVAADGVAKAFAVELPEGIGTMYFLRLELRDRAGAPQSSNFYWLSTTPDIPGSPIDDWKSTFATNPKSRADFKQLESLPAVAVEATPHLEREEDLVRGSVTVRNTGSHLAFGVTLSLLTGGESLEAAPVYWSENHLALMPGETRQVNVEAPSSAFPNGMPRVRVQGWNVTSK